jgi:hypothetical protein
MGKLKLNSYTHYNEKDFPFAEDQGCAPENPDNWSKAWIGYLILALSLSRFQLFMDFDKYFSSYLNPDKSFPDRTMRINPLQTV